MVERIIREHGEDVIRFLASRLFTPDRQEDALDCFSRAAQIFCEKHSVGLTPPEDDVNLLVGYLYNCARNIAREENARYLRHRRLLEENVDEIRDNLFQDEAYRRQIVEAVETLFEFFGNFLAERELRIMALRYREGLSFERIAEELGLEPANVRKIHQRTIERIQELIFRFRGPEGPGSGGRPIVGKRSRTRRPATGSQNIGSKEHIKLSDQIDSDIQAYLIIQLFKDYGSLCRHLGVRMFNCSTLTGQIEPIDEHSIKLYNSISLTASLLIRTFSAC